MLSVAFRLHKQAKEWQGGGVRAGMPMNPVED
jgi:hypothetical protein